MNVNRIKRNVWAISIVMSLSTCVVCLTGAWYLLRAGFVAIPREHAMLFVCGCVIATIIGGSVAASLCIYCIKKMFSQLSTSIVDIARGDFDEIEAEAVSEDMGGIVASIESLRQSMKYVYTTLEEVNEEVRISKEDFQEKNKQLHDILCSLSYPLYVVNLNDNTVKMMNPAAAQCMADEEGFPFMCGKVGKAKQESQGCMNHDCPLEYIHNTKKSAVCDHEYEVRGEKRFVEIHAFPVKNLDGDVDQAVLSCIDITGRKLAEKENIRLLNELSQSQRLESIGTLAAGIAHEMNTPIQFIATNTRYLAKGLVKLLDIIKQYRICVSKLSYPAEQQAIVDEATALETRYKLSSLETNVLGAISDSEEGINRVGDIVGAMKDFSYVGGDEMALEDINEAIETTLTITRNEWKYKCDIQKELQRNLPHVECCIGDIKQAMLNLIVNATHAICDVVNEGVEDKGIITIRTVDHGDTILIEVGDTGSGIPRNVQDRIFEPFFTTKAVGKGTGQGLSLVYQTVVDKHNGKITFSTEEGKGTIFQIELPVSQEDVSTTHNDRGDV